MADLGRIAGCVGATEREAGAVLCPCCLLCGFDGADQQLLFGAGCKYGGIDIEFVDSSLSVPVNDTPCIVRYW